MCWAAHSLRNIGKTLQRETSGIDSLSLTFEARRSISVTERTILAWKGPSLLMRLSWSVLVHSLPVGSVRSWEYTRYSVWGLRQVWYEGHQAWVASVGALQLCRSLEPGAWPSGRSSLWMPFSGVGGGTSTPLPAAGPGPPPFEWPLPKDTNH